MHPAKLAANEEIRRKQVELRLDPAAPLPFICECDDTACRTLVRLTPAAYEMARETGDRCIVASGHPYVGRVVHDGDGYVITET